MKTLFVEHKLLTFLILVLFFFSVLCQFIIGFLYQNMIKESHNMSSTNNKLLKQCKLKFSNCYELHQGVANISVFVDKFMHGIRIGVIPVKTIYHASGQLMLLSIFAAGSGACRAIASGDMIGNIVPYYILSFLLLYLYFAMTGLADVKGKKTVLKTNLMDYLENNMSLRIPQSRQEQERLDALEALTGKRGIKKEIAAQEMKEEELDELDGIDGIKKVKTKEKGKTRGTKLEQKVEADGARELVLTAAEERELELLLAEVLK